MFPSPLTRKSVLLFESLTEKPSLTDDPPNFASISCADRWMGMNTEIKSKKQKNLFIAVPLMKLILVVYLEYLMSLDLMLNQI
jgi:hypothetical protein